MPSQGATAQLIARIYAGTGANQTNISCQAGHLQFTSQGASSQTAVSPVVSIDSNGVATANQPGSVLITGNISNAASSAGFFSTCPPASITLTATGSTTNPVVVNQNNTQPLLATVVDTKGVRPDRVEPGIRFNLAHDGSRRFGLCGAAACRRRVDFGHLPASELQPCLL